MRFDDLLGDVREAPIDLFTSLDEQALRQGAPIAS
jgi:hypothetical protein